MTLILTPPDVDLATLESIYRSPEAVSLDSECQEAVQAAHDTVMAAAGGDEAVYGVNTGFGKLAQTRIAPEDTATLQRNLILSHASGVGPTLPDGVVRLVMTTKLISLGRGASGVRWELIQLLQDMLSKNILPVIPAQGSVGASGDLAPLAHMTAALIGEGEAVLDGQTMPARDALSKAGLEPIELGPKEGLGMINGTQVSTALALAALFETRRLAKTALVTGALSTDAAMGSAAPFRPEVHELRGHAGQIEAGQVLRALMAGSEIRESHREDDQRVQDPYCLRCQPQVMGACLDLLDVIAHTLEIEANAVTDNPLVLDDGDIISGGNFHAEPVAFAADQMALAIAEIGAIAQRRIAMLVDPAMNFGLPAFLTPRPGLNSGFMIAEVTSAALMSENKQKAGPCSVDSTPTSANQEDHVSMACHAAYRLHSMNDNLANIIAIEYLVASQGVEFREPLATSAPLQAAIDRLRQDVPSLGDDRLIAPDIEAAATLVAGGAVLEAIEAAL